MMNGVSEQEQSQASQQVVLLPTELLLHIIASMTDVERYIFALSHRIIFNVVLAEERRLLYTRTKQQKFTIEQMLKYGCFVLARCYLNQQALDKTRLKKILRENRYNLKKVGVFFNKVYVRDSVFKFELRTVLYTLLINELRGGIFSKRKLRRIGQLSQAFSEDLAELPHLICFQLARYCDDFKIYPEFVALMLLMPVPVIQQYISFHSFGVDFITHFSDRAIADIISSATPGVFSKITNALSVERLQHIAKLMSLEHLTNLLHQFYVFVNDNAIAKLLCLLPSREINYFTNGNISRERLCQVILSIDDGYMPILMGMLGIKSTRYCLNYLLGLKNDAPNRENFLRFVSGLPTAYLKEVLRGEHLYSYLVYFLNYYHKDSRVERLFSRLFPFLAETDQVRLLGLQSESTKQKIIFSHMAGMDNSSFFMLWQQLCIFQPQLVSRNLSLLPNEKIILLSASVALPVESLLSVDYLSITDLIYIIRNSSADNALLWLYALDYGQAQEVLRKLPAIFIERVLVVSLMRRGMNDIAANVFTKLPCDVLPGQSKSVLVEVVERLSPSILRRYYSGLIESRILGPMLESTVLRFTRLGPIQNNNTYLHWLNSLDAQMLLDYIEIKLKLAQANRNTSLVGAAQFSFERRVQNQKYEDEMFAELCFIFSYVSVDALGKVISQLSSTAYSHVAKQALRVAFFIDRPDVSKAILLASPMDDVARGFLELLQEFNMARLLLRNVAGVFSAMLRSDCLRFLSAMMGYTNIEFLTVIESFIGQPIFPRLMQHCPHRGELLRYLLVTTNFLSSSRFKEILYNLRLDELTVLLNSLSISADIEEHVLHLDVMDSLLEETSSRKQYCEFLLANASNEYLIFFMRSVGDNIAKQEIVDAMIALLPCEKLAAILLSLLNSRAMLAFIHSCQQFFEQSKKINILLQLLAKVDSVQEDEDVWFDVDEFWQVLKPEEQLQAWQQASPYIRRMIYVNLAIDAIQKDISNNELLAQLFPNDLIRNSPAQLDMLLSMSVQRAIPLLLVYPFKNQLIDFFNQRLQSQDPAVADQIDCLFLLRALLLSDLPRYQRLLISILDGLSRENVLLFSRLFIIVKKNKKRNALYYTNSIDAFVESFNAISNISHFNSRKHAWVMPQSFFDGLLASGDNQRMLSILLHSLSDEVFLNCMRASHLLPRDDYDSAINRFNLKRVAAVLNACCQNDDSATEIDVSKLQRMVVLFSQLYESQQLALLPYLSIALLKHLLVCVDLTYMPTKILQPLLVQAWQRLLIAGNEHSATELLLSFTINNAALLFVNFSHVKQQQYLSQLIKLGVEKQTEQLQAVLHQACGYMSKRDVECLLHSASIETAALILLHLDIHMFCDFVAAEIIVAELFCRQQRAVLDYLQADSVIDLIAILPKLNAATVLCSLEPTQQQRVVQVMLLQRRTLLGNILAVLSQVEVDALCLQLPRKMQARLPIKRNASQGLSEQRQRPLAKQKMGLIGKLGEHRVDNQLPSQVDASKNIEGKENGLLIVSQQPRQRKRHKRGKSTMPLELGRVIPIYSFWRRENFIAATRRGSSLTSSSPRISPRSNSSIYTV